ncbi:MAG: acyltransferase family protein [Prevotella sp.]|nr:acyltransferase family protein [Prevotella sp.]
MGKYRFNWIDTSKGLLIIFVIFYHIPVFAGQYNIDNFNWMFYSYPFYKYYFMPAFFIITGFCSSFVNRSFLLFVKQNFKTLILPGFFVSIGIPWCSHLLRGNTQLLYYWIPIKDFLYTGGFWFLTSLFFGKVIYYIIFNLSHSTAVRGGLTLLLLVIGCVMRVKGVENIWFIQNTLCLCVFFCIGNFLFIYREMLLEKRMILIYSLIYFTIVCMSNIYNFELPFVTLHVSIDFYNIPLFLILSITGSMMLLGLSKMMGEISILESIGRRTLVIYIFHMYIILKVLPLLVGKLSQGVMGGTIGILLVIFTIIVCIGIDVLLNTRYLKWFLGKF